MTVKYGGFCLFCFFVFFFFFFWVEAKWSFIPRVFWFFNDQNKKIFEIF
jgi:hypothetical protein